jgi:hypothetical protein
MRRRMQWTRGEVIEKLLQNVPEHFVEAGSLAIKPTFRCP